MSRSTYRIIQIYYQLKYHFISVKSIIPRRKTKIQCSSFFPFSRWVDRSFDCKINLDNNLVHQVLKVLMTGQLVAFHKTLKQKAFITWLQKVLHHKLSLLDTWFLDLMESNISLPIHVAPVNLTLFLFRVTYNNNYIYTILSYLMIKIPFVIWQFSIPPMV